MNSKCTLWFVFECKKGNWKKKQEKKKKKRAYEFLARTKMHKGVPHVGGTQALSY